MPAKAIPRRPAKRPAPAPKEVAFSEWEGASRLGQVVVIQDDNDR